MLLEIQDVVKRYRSPDGELQPVLDIERFTLDEREQVVLEGRSGSGKTTLLHLIAGLLVPDAGSVVIDGTHLEALSEARRDAFRARHIGYVFQQFHLLGGYTALENVVLGMSFGPGIDRRYARELLERLGMGERLHHTPEQLSIGQRQRVAVARALANRPRLVLADEPTGNLDAVNGREALALIREVARERGAALLVVSHDELVLSAFETRYDLADLNRVESASHV
ncbi:MAG: ABC transporter ATP-binding protein [Planctomycetota bacterium]